MAACPYTRSASNMVHQHNIRPYSDPTNQMPLQNNDVFFDQQNNPIQHCHYPNSTATSSTSTLVVGNNGNGGPLSTPGNTPKTERKGKRISNIFVGYIMFILKHYMYIFSVKNIYPHRMSELPRIQQILIWVLGEQFH